MNQRGVSPLIATVLLIAFAVALGAVLMTYSGSFGECGSVSFQISELEEKPDICYDSKNNTLTFVIENGERSAIEGFKITMQGTIDIYTLERNDTLAKSDTRRYTINYPFRMYGPLQKVKIIPYLKEGSETTICPLERSLIIEGIPPCSST